MTGYIYINTYMYIYNIGHGNSIKSVSKLWLVSGPGLSKDYWSRLSQYHRFALSFHTQQTVFMYTAVYDRRRETKLLRLNNLEHKKFTTGMKRVRMKGWLAHRTLHITCNSNTHTCKVTQYSQSDSMHNYGFRYLYTTHVPFL